MVLPAMGVTNEPIACFSRRLIFGYRFVATTTLGIASIGYLVWGHHMFVAGMRVYASSVFSILTFVVAVPSGIKVYNCTTTSDKGRVRLRHPCGSARLHRPVPRLAGVRRVRDRHLFRGGAFPLHHGGRHGVGLYGGAAFLVAEDDRPPVPGTLGMWVFLASETMMFGVLFMVLAVTAARRGRSCEAAWELAGAAILGLAFLAIKATEWGLEAGEVPMLPQQPGLRLFFGFHDIATGLHALHLGLGVLVVAALAFLVRRSPDRAGAVEMGGLYWYLVDVVWVSLYPLLYLAAPR